MALSLPDEQEATLPGMLGEGVAVAAFVVAWIVIVGMTADLTALASWMPLAAQAVILCFLIALLMITARRVSGGHLNPLMTFIYGIDGRLPWGQTLAMSAAHLLGAVAAMLAAIYFLPDAPAGAMNEAHLIGEWLAAILLVNVIVAVRNEELHDAAFCIGATVALIYWLSGGATLVNPAITLMQGIFGLGLNTVQAGPIMAAQFAGALTGLALARLIWR
jgi:glycerol uptake facilitator-like aquaporin